MVRSRSSKRSACRRSTFSAGPFDGVVAQNLALTHPELVRKVIVAGSGSGTAPGMPAMPDRVADIMSKPGASLEDLLYLFYPETDDARAKGLDHFGRIEAEMPNGAPQVSQDAAMGQLTAITAILSTPWDAVARDLATITTPIL